MTQVTDDALGKTQWQYFRHHNSDFLGMGLVKVAFLWELLISGLDVLISTKPSSNPDPNPNFNPDPEPSPSPNTNPSPNPNPSP